MDDVFDLSRIRLSQNFAATGGAKKLLTTVPVRKPNRQEFVRVHPDPEYMIEAAVLELKEQREYYLVAPEMCPELMADISPKILYTCINRQGTLTLWPIRLPGKDGRLDPWNQSALDAADRAKTNWIRVAANMSLGANDIYEAAAHIAEPEWPELSFQEIITLAFKNRIIEAPDHPIVRQLRGES